MHTFSTWRLFAELKFIDSHKKLNGIQNKFCTELLQKLVASPLDVGLILAWARGASAEEYSFHPQGGLDRARNVTVLVKSIANATQLLPSVHSHPQPFAMGLPTFPRFLLLNVLGLCSYL